MHYYDDDTSRRDDRTKSDGLAVDDLRRTVRVVREFQTKGFRI